VIVATLRSLKYQGGVKIEALNIEDVAAVSRGFENLQKHIENIRLFGVPCVVALNRFPSDTAAEIGALEALLRPEKVRFAQSEVFSRGGEGGLDLAREILAAAAEGDAHQFPFLYPLEMPLLDKVETVARKIYGAAGIAMEGKVRRRILKLEKDGFGQLPVCIAKTQYSLSDDAEHLGRPRDFTLIVTDAWIFAGAGFAVVQCGEILTMPGLPRTPAAERIDVGDDGSITGIG
jgi:formate--tetrahydrofolate ligase